MEAFKQFQAMSLEEVTHQKQVSHAIFSYNNSLPSLLDSSDTMMLVLRELKVVGSAIQNFTRIQEETAQSFMAGIRTLQEILVKQQSCQQCKQMTSDTQTCNECFKRVCQYCQKHLQIAYRNCGQCRGLYCSSHQQQCLRCQVFYCVKCSPKLQQTGICVNCLHGKAPPLKEQIAEQPQSKSRNTDQEGVKRAMTVAPQSEKLYRKSVMKEPESILNVSWMKYRQQQQKEIQLSPQDIVVDQKHVEQPVKKEKQSVESSRAMLMLCFNRAQNKCSQESTEIPPKSYFMCKFCQKQYCDACRLQCGWCKTPICTNCQIYAKSYVASVDGSLKEGNQNFSCCPNDVVYCDQCKVAHTKAYVLLKCKKCRSNICNDCMQACGECKRREYCGNCLTSCKKCKKKLCLSCKRNCFKCQQHFCSKVCSRVNCSQCQTSVCEEDQRTAKQVDCVKCNKQFCSYCVQLKNIMKCHSCEIFFGMCNDCEMSNVDQLGEDGVLKNKFYSCTDCQTRVCYNCKLQYRGCCIDCLNSRQEETQK